MRPSRATRAAVFLPIMLLPMTPALALVCAAVIGLLYPSTVAPTSGIVALVFGPKNFSMLHGIVLGGHQLGGLLGG